MIPKFAPDAALGGGPEEVIGEQHPAQLRLGLQPVFPFAAHGPAFLFPNVVSIGRHGLRRQGSREATGWLRDHLLVLGGQERHG